MDQTNVDIPKEIAIMWNAYKQLASVLPSHNNPESEINCSILDVIVATSEPEPQSLAAFGNYLKFMLGSIKEGVLLSPTEEVFNSWYKKV
jgi:hypothetical protein